MQSKSHIAERDADAQRRTRPRAHVELPAEIERVRCAGPGRKVAAVAAAVHAELHELVTDSEHERAGQVRRERGDELDVARRDAGDRVAVLIRAIEVAVVDEVHRAADDADAAGREIGAEHVAAPRDERRRVQGELIVGQRGETSGVPERSLPPPGRRGGSLAHADGLRTHGKNEEKSAGVEG